MPPPAAPPPPPDKCDQPFLQSPLGGTVTGDSTQRPGAELPEHTASSKELAVSIPSAQKSTAPRPKAAKVNPEMESAPAPPAIRRERKLTKKADEFREMLMASRRRFGKVREPIDTSKLTMLDLIYYNPPGAPMKRKAEVRRAKRFVM